MQSLFNDLGAGAFVMIHEVPQNLARLFIHPEGYGLAHVLHGKTFRPSGQEEGTGPGLTSGRDELQFRRIKNKRAALIFFQRSIAARENPYVPLQCGTQAQAGV